MKLHRKKRLAMTAIEVLAATVLASLMLASVAGVLGALARQERVLRAKTDTPHWHQQLADQMRWDLTNSRRFAVSRNGVRLEGFASRDFATARPTGRPAIIEYYLAQTSSDRWLVRREQHLDERTNSPARVELVCRGVERFQWGSEVVDQIAAAPTGPTLPSEAPLTKTPERLAVQLYGPASVAPVFDTTFEIH